MLFFDVRWIGAHGIGRVAAELARRLHYSTLPLTGHPASPIETFRLFFALRRLGRDDLFFTPGINVPFICTRPIAITIHDLNQIDLPCNSGLLKRLYFNVLLRRACRKSRVVFTDTEYFRQRIIDWAGVAPEKVVNTACGVSEIFTPEGPDPGFAFPYVLCVSNRKPHKNEHNTLQGFARADIDPEIKLVFTGDATPQLEQLARALGVGQRVAFAGRVSEPELAKLYRGARALAFPSLYEGFGLPVVEAMACGTPVMTSNISVLPETAGGAALLVDPHSVDEIAQGIELLLSDADLRAELIEKGLQRAKDFSWDKVAAVVAEALDRARGHASGSQR